MLANEFILLCKKYSETKSNTICDTVEDSKKLCKYKIELYGYVVEFRYVKKEYGGFKASSLYCVIKLRKNSVVYYHLTDIIPFLKDKSFKSCYFWHIESPERLKNCFVSLVEALELILSQIEPFLSDDTVLSDSLFQNYRSIYKLKPKDIDFKKIDNPNDFSHSYFLALQKARDEYVFSRYSYFTPYALLLKKDTDKALVKYEKLRKQNKLTEYEKDLIDHIVNSKDQEFNAFDPSCDTSTANAVISHTSLLKAFALCFVVFSALFCGFFAVYNSIASIGTVIYLAAPWYSGFLFSGLCSVVGGMLFFAYLPSKSIHKAERKRITDILIPKPLKIFLVILFLVSVAISGLFAVMTVKSNVRFYEESVKFDKATYTYAQIDSVYLIDARYNVYGERIERPSYVILFGDKSSLDLDGYASVEFTEKEIIPFLKNKNLTVNYADSEKDLPWYTDE